MKQCHQRVKVMQVMFTLCILQVSLVIEPAAVPIAHSEPKPNNPSGRPQRTATGGRRGSCPEVFPPLIALVPLSTATTTAERPTFWFYSPYNGQALTATFTLQSDDNNVIEPITVTLPAKPSVVRLQLRSTDAPLTPNQPYRWFFKVLCSDQNQPKDTVEGSVQRLALTPLGTLAFRQKQALSDATDGRLFDAVAALAALRLSKPQDAFLLEEWKQLLRSLKFELESQPLTPEQVNAIATSPLNDL